MRESHEWADALNGAKPHKGKTNSQTIAQLWPDRSGRASEANVSYWPWWWRVAALNLSKTPEQKSDPQ